MLLLPCPCLRRALPVNLPPRWRPRLRTLLPVAGAGTSPLVSGMYFDDWFPQKGGFPDPYPDMVSDMGAFSFWAAAAARLLATLACGSRRHRPFLRQHASWPACRVGPCWRYQARPRAAQHTKLSRRDHHNGSGSANNSPESTAPPPQPFVSSVGRGGWVTTSTLMAHVLMCPNPNTQTPARPDAR